MTVIFAGMNNMMNGRNFSGDDVIILEEDDGKDGMNKRETEKVALTHLRSVTELSCYV